MFFFEPITPMMLNGRMWLVWCIYWMIAAGFVQKTKVEEGPLRRMTHSIPSLVGFFLIFHDRDYAIFHGRLYRNLDANWIGTAATLLGLAISVWARVHLGKYWSGIITLKEGHKLIRTGPYRWVRHPIYTGLLTAAAGSALTASTGDGWVGFVMILVAFVVKSRREETLLTTEFGDEYRQFKREVPAIFPLIY